MDTPGNSLLVPVHAAGALCSLAAWLRLKLWVRLTRKSRVLLAPL
jgi:hypothetical protein